MPREAIEAARPHLLRAAAFTLVFVAAVVVTDVHGQLRGDGATTTERTIAIAGALVAVVSGALAIRSLAQAIRRSSIAVGAASRGGSLGFVASLVGQLVVLLTVLGALGVPLQGIFLGGALTGIVLGIAAQQTLGNFFAGIVLLVVRPFSIGEEVALRSAPLGGLYEGRVEEMTLFYVHLRTARGPVSLPNAGVLAAAVGPGTRDPEVRDEEPGAG